MNLFVRKLLVFFVFIVLYSTQTSFATEERMRCRYGGSSTQTKTITKEEASSITDLETQETKFYRSGPDYRASTHSSQKNMTGSKMEEPKQAWWQKREWSWWQQPFLLVATLFDPFIEDAPKVWDALKDEGRKLDKMGVDDYLVDTGINTVKAVISAAKEDPLEFSLNVITQGGAFLLGYTNVAESSTILPLIIGTAGGIKNSQLLFSASKALPSKSTIDKAFKIGLIVGGVYLIAAVPVSYGLETINLGTQYQASATTPGALRCNIAQTSTPGTAFGVWLDSSFNVVGSTMTATTSGSILTLSASPTIASAIPGITCSTTNPLCITAYKCGTDICVRPFNPFTGALSAISNANTATTTNIGLGSCTRFSDDTLTCSWAASDAGNFQVLFRTYSPSTGASLNTPMVANLSPTIAQGENCIVGMSGSPSKALLAWRGGSSPNFFVNTAIINSDGSIASTAQSVATDSTSLQSLTCFTAGSEGRIGWIKSNAAEIIRINTNGAAIGGRFTLQGTSGTVSAPVGIGTPDGGSLITVSQNPGGFGTVYGGTFLADAIGTPDSTFVQIPSGTNVARPVCLAVVGGTSPNYNVLAAFQGVPVAGAELMQVRNINVQGGATTSPTTGPTMSPTTGPTISPTAPTNSTGAPTSAASSITPTCLYWVAPALALGDMIWGQFMNNNDIQNKVSRKKTITMIEEEPSSITDLETNTTTYYPTGQVTH